jgi:L-aspartate oxidase
MINQTVTSECDVLIIGTGIGGLSAAIKLAEDKKLKILLVTRASKPENANTYWAQGGIIYHDKNDLDLEQDIQKASSGTSFSAAINLILERSPHILKEVLLEKVETDFAKDSSGKLLFTREAAHSRPRIIYQGDYTGKAIELSLLNYIEKLENITILASHTAIDLITPSHHGTSLEQRYDDHEVVGAYLFDQQARIVKKVIAKKTILATGGVGSLYLHHTNTNSARGDGHAMAFRAGAQVLNMEFIQFHPTTLYTTNATQRRFLITEALRGEGAILYNMKGERFMERYHPDMELAPRDVVSRAIHTEMISSGAEHVYIDITHKPGEWIKNRFPTIYEHCLENKIDMTTQPIPVVPAAHYTCGGVKVDLKGRTTIKNLLAVGEVACTGLHGANRLASTSLLEALTWGYVASENILKEIHELKSYPAEKIKNWILGSKEVDTTLIAQDIMTLRQTMWNYVGITRSRERLMRARAMFAELSDEIQKFYKDALLHDDLIGLRNGVEVAQMVLNSSRRNQHSIGSFYRNDTTFKLDTSFLEN